jgi:hypothetical protein
MGRKINDGAKTGLKQDRFRNSRFEYELTERPNQYGMSKKTINTLGGVFQENRGRRSSDQLDTDHWKNSPFENGELYNWNHRQGWDQYYDHSYERGNRRHGGSLIGHDRGKQGLGPKGYKRKDKDIYEDVCDMLSLSPDVDASDIEVRVENGIVYLTGAVTDRRTKKLAELEIENISGIHDIQNQLKFYINKKELH